MDVYLATPVETGSLVRLVAVLHARGATLVDLQYSGVDAKQYRMSATFLASSVRAENVVRSLRRAIYVADVVLSDGIATTSLRS